MAINYSSTDPKMLEISNREIMAKQILGVLKQTSKSKDLKKCRVLDLGCSTGIISNFLADNVNQITGIDVDKAAIKYAQNKFKKKNLKFLVMDGTKLAFTKNHFDIVICNQVLFYVKDSTKLMSEINRVLKPKGICFFSSSNNFYQFYLQKFTSQSSQIKNIKSLTQLERLCANFKISDCTLKILANPDKYGYEKLRKFQPIFKIIPTRFWQHAEFLMPNIIWILEKV